MDTTALFKLTYGLYIVGTLDGERPVGCTINTCFQVTSQNPILAISLNKNNYTLDAIRRSRRFSLSVVAEESDWSVIGSFGFHTSRDVDKYADYGYEMLSGAPIVNGTFAARLVLDAINFVDNETHVVVLARLVDAVKGSGKPMTYEYYHAVVKGSAPKNAPTYVAPADETPQPAATDTAAKRKFRCDVCGYEVEFEGDMPDDYKCPLCNAPKSKFTEITA
ncbi:MAG: flavin reductase [Muribaculaceae bacterium]